jgi:hypothetical protein
LNRIAFAIKLYDECTWSCVFICNQK